MRLWKKKAQKRIPIPGKFLTRAAEVQLDWESVIESVDSDL